MKPGDTITFRHYGVEKTETIGRISPDGTIVYTTMCRWLHKESILSVNNVPVSGTSTKEKKDEI
jgi:signal peptidase I